MHASHSIITPEGAPIAFNSHTPTSEALPAPHPIQPVQATTLYSVLRMISIFISSRSCSEMQSWKKAAEEGRQGVRQVGQGAWAKTMLGKEDPYLGGLWGWVWWGRAPPDSQSKLLPWK